MTYNAVQSMNRWFGVFLVAAAQLVNASPARASQSEAISSIRSAEDSHHSIGALGWTAGNLRRHRQQIQRKARRTPLSGNPRELTAALSAALQVQSYRVAELKKALAEQSSNPGHAVHDRESSTATKKGNRKRTRRRVTEADIEAAETLWREAHLLALSVVTHIDRDSRDGSSLGDLVEPASGMVRRIVGKGTTQRRGKKSATRRLLDRSRQFLEEGVIRSAYGSSLLKDASNRASDHESVQVFRRQEVDFRNRANVAAKAVGERVLKDPTELDKLGLTPQQIPSDPAQRQKLAIQIGLKLDNSARQLWEVAEQNKQKADQLREQVLLSDPIVATLLQQGSMNTLGGDLLTLRAHLDGIVGTRRLLRRSGNNSSPQRTRIRQRDLQVRHSLIDQLGDKMMGGNPTVKKDGVSVIAGDPPVVANVLRIPMNVEPPPWFAVAHELDQQFAQSTGESLILRGATERYTRDLEDHGPVLVDLSERIHLPNQTEASGVASGGLL